MAERSQGAAEPQVFRCSTEARLGLMAVGVGGSILFCYFAVVDSPGFLLFTSLCPLLVLDGLRAQISVDPARGIVHLQSALRSRAVPIADIKNVRVPPRGPIALTLREGSSVKGDLPWRTQILTSVHADRTGSRGRAARLAALLDVPVVAASRYVQPDYEPSADREPLTLRALRPGASRSGSDTAVLLIVALCLSILAAMIVATVVFA